MIIHKYIKNEGSHPLDMNKRLFTICLMNRTIQLHFRFSITIFAILNFISLQRDTAISVLFIDQRLMFTLTSTYLPFIFTLPYTYLSSHNFSKPLNLSKTATNFWSVTHCTDEYKIRSNTLQDDEIYDVLILTHEGVSFH